MADSQIVVKGAQAPPLDYRLAGALEVVLRVVRADYDGSGAGAAYLPAIQILSPAGLVVGTFAASSSVAAGASADVTWFPRSVAAAAATPSAGSAQFATVSLQGTQTIGAGAGANISFDTLDDDTSGGVIWTIANPTKLFAPSTGIYLVSWFIDYNPASVTAHPYWFFFTSLAGDTAATRQQEVTTIGHTWAGNASYPVHLTAGASVTSRCDNTGGAAVTIGAGVGNGGVNMALAGPL